MRSRNTDEKTGAAAISGRDSGSLSDGSDNGGGQTGQRWGHSGHEGKAPGIPHAALEERNIHPQEQGPSVKLCAQKDMFFQLALGILWAS